MTMTISDILSWITGDEFRPVKYEKFIYVISSYRLGQEEFDYGIYGKYPIQDFESGSVVDSVIDSIPDAFIDDMINDAVTESGLAENLTDEVKQQLYDAPLSDWYKILEKAGITSNYSESYVELSKIIDGVANCKADTISAIPEPDELECIKKYNEENEL